MKKELFSFWVLISILLLQIPMAMAQPRCNPNGTVYREGCPREVLINSLCEEKDPCVNWILGPTSISKWEVKTITWANTSQNVTLGTYDNGQSGCYFSCADIGFRGWNECWPAFNTPLITQTSWTQTVVGVTQLK
jgi:hypothetical protein